MKEVDLVKSAKTEVFKNGIVIPRYVLIDRDLDLNKKFILSSLLLLQNGLFKDSYFLVSTEFLFSIGLDGDYDVDDVMTYFKDKEYLHITEKFVSYPVGWYLIQINCSYEEYISSFESIENCKRTYRTYFDCGNIEDHPEVDSQWFEKINCTFLETSEEWDKLSVSLDERLPDEY